MRPLDGIKVIEMAGLAPSPYCGMILADFGADVVVVDRLTTGMPEIPNVMSKNPFDRGKRSVRINLKTEAGISIIERMIESADVLLEPYRPGVMEEPWSRAGRGAGSKSETHIRAAHRLGSKRALRPHGRA
jgi:alpha-methylacyl-CoA racemase